MGHVMLQRQNPSLGKLLWARKQQSLPCAVSAWLVWTCPSPWWLQGCCWSWPLRVDMHSHTVQQPSLCLSWEKTCSHRSAGIYSLLEHILDGKSRLESSLQGPSWGLVRVRGISLCWVSFPLEQLQAAGFRPRQRQRRQPMCTPFLP